MANFSVDDSSLHSFSPLGEGNVSNLLAETKKALKLCDDNVDEGTNYSCSVFREFALSRTDRPHRPLGLPLPNNFFDDNISPSNHHNNL